MGDPAEGLTADGMIRTGAGSQAIPHAYVELLEDVVGLAHSEAPSASIYVYGSVATGQANPPRSDVDLLSIGLGAQDASVICAELSGRYQHLCRGVEIAATTLSDFEGASDEAYGNRAFLRHYCVHLAGPDRDTSAADFPGDRRAARGFNGDIAIHAARWHDDLGASDAHHLARRIARKMLLAVAALVSVHDDVWTTDRDIAVRRWSQIDPQHAAALAQLQTWVTNADEADNRQVAAILNQTVNPLVLRFEQDIGLWPS